MLRPVVGRGRPWVPKRRAEATCGCGDPSTRPPSSTARAASTAPSPRRAPSHALSRRTGRVALWGRVVEHELGFRAPYGYPQRLRLICQFCFWQWGRTRTGPGVVAGSRGERSCRCVTIMPTLAWRYGMRPQAWLLSERSIKGSGDVRGGSAGDLAAPLRPGGRDRRGGGDPAPARVGAPHQAAADSLPSTGSFSGTSGASTSAATPRWVPPAQPRRCPAGCVVRIGFTVRACVPVRRLGAAPRPRPARLFASSKRRSASRARSSAAAIRASMEAIA